MRLWTFKEKPWPKDKYNTRYRSVRRIIEIGTRKNPYGVFISTEFEKIKDDGTSDSSLFWDLFCIGLDLTFKFGHESMQYDGFWHRLSFGPLYCNWYSGHQSLFGCDCKED